jgi:hypothetical protein
MFCGHKGFNISCQLLQMLMTMVNNATETTKIHVKMHDLLAVQ